MKQAEYALINQACDSNGKQEEGKTGHVPLSRSYRITTVIRNVLTHVVSTLDNSLDWTLNWLMITGYKYFSSSPAAWIRMQA